MLKKKVQCKKSQKSWRVVNSATDPYIMVFSSFSRKKNSPFPRRVPQKTITVVGTTKSNYHAVNYLQITSVASSGDVADEQRHKVLLPTCVE
jgi:hypothetical protein